MDITVLSELIANFVSFVFGILEDVNLSPLDNALETCVPFLKAALYILPAESMGQIFSVICAIWSTRLILKALQALWAILPIF